MNHMNIKNISEIKFNICAHLNSLFSLWPLTLEVFFSTNFSKQKFLTLQEVKIQALYLSYLYY